MRSIGFRCSPTQIYYAIIESASEELSIINVDKIILPKSMEMPGKLKHLRNTISDILSEYKICFAGIRATEVISQNISYERLYCEGVIMELLSDSAICKYYVGYSANIPSKIGIDHGQFKPIVDGVCSFDCIAEFSSYNKEEKESILTAIGAFHA
jgi:hypothetical protein